MKEAISDVAMFHEVFDLPIAEKPTQVTAKQMQLRLDLLDEEYCEYRRAAQSGDLVEIADALADIIYIAIGTALVYGIPLEEVWESVQMSNISKAGPCPDCDSYCVDYGNQPCRWCSGNGYLVNYFPNGKVAKPEGWKAPDIKAIIEKARNG